MIKTIISNKKQDLIEPFKPVFKFGFMDQPKFIGTECRGKIAHMLKCYRANPLQYKIKRNGLHDYEIQCGSAVARIWS